MVFQRTYAVLLLMPVALVQHKCNKSAAIGKWWCSKRTVIADVFVLVLLQRLYCCLLQVLLVVVQHTSYCAAIAESYLQGWCFNVYILLLLVLLEEGWRACAATAAGCYWQGGYSNVHMVLLVLAVVQRTCAVGVAGVGCVAMQGLP